MTILDFIYRVMMDKEKVAQDVVKAGTLNVIVENETQFAREVSGAISYASWFH